VAKKQRNAAPLVASLVLIGVFTTAIGLGRALGMPMPSLDVNWPRSDGKVMTPSKPTRLSISSLGVRANVVEVGKADDGSIAPPVEDPARTVGWYGLGPTPGEPGTAVLVGHVDTDSRPGVFHNLRDIQVGKLIEVSRKDRRVATFRVDSVESFPKDQFPADRVLVHSDVPRLALVTCGGEWVGGDTGYADNIIVFAHLA
jgi:Sortase (surface protein transpeptidase)